MHYPTDIVSRFQFAVSLYYRPPPLGPHSRRMLTKERQRLLQEQYYFLCQCEACSLQMEEKVKEQWSGLHESGLLCTKCKGSLKVGVHYLDCDFF